MDKYIFQAYADLEKEKRDIELQQKQMKEQILTQLRLINADTAKTEWGAFNIVKRKKWSYSDVVKELKTAVDNRIAEEQAKGLATYTEEDSVAFYPVKEINQETNEQNT